MPAPPYRSRKRPDYLARAEWNDYFGRRIYMVTITATKGAPQFSRIEGSESGAGVEARAALTPVGEIIARQISALHRRYGFVDILSSCVMPDHIHFVIFVKEKNNIDLGHIVGSFKRLCDADIKEAFPNIRLPDGNHSVFSKGFNDRIVYREGQLENFNRYVADNPRRLYLKQAHPEFFNSRCLVSINGKKYSLYGNLLLLRHCLKSAVRISRTFSPEEIKRRRMEWEEVIRGRGVLVSPFISKPEKEIRDLASQSGASIIHIIPEGFPERFKPSGLDFDLCSTGRPLIIAPPNRETRHTALSREFCLAMNTLAETVAAATLTLSVRVGAN